MIAPRTGWVLAALCAFMPVAGALEVSENRECATCHIMWLKDFKRGGVTPLVPYDPKPADSSGRVDVASHERMCFSCHDGFMLESRSVWRDKRHEHPVGVKPSAKIRIPTSRGKTVFPLNDDGKVYCGTCHTAHGVDWAQKDSPLFLRARNVESSLCMACHLEQATGPKEGNHPLFRAAGKPPAELVQAGAKFGADGAVVCESCHRTHGGAENKMLVVTHREAKLCAACHADKGEIRNTKHDLSVMAPDSKNSQGLSPADSGPCAGCHLPHNAGGPRLWARELAPAVDTATARCLGCHRPEGLGKKKLTGEHSHPVDVAVDKAGIAATPKNWTSRFARAGDAPLKPLPLYDDKGLYTDKDGRMGCGTCHDPHRWTSKPPPPPVAGVEPVPPHKQEGNGDSSFLRLPADATGTLCANCHVDKASVALSRHNPNVMAATLRGKDGTKKVTAPTDAQATAVRDVCGACHATHNAKSEKLWALDKGPGKGRVIPMCTACHREGGEASAKVIGENSHTKNCNSCHDPHQWDPADARNLAGAQPDTRSDARTSFLKKSAGGSAELCRECHEEQMAVIGTDHDLRITAPAAQNAKGLTVETSGVCGQCHQLHNAPAKPWLWGRATGKGEHPSEKFCTGCHGPGGAAEGKVPREARHPVATSVWSPKLRATFKPAAGKYGLPVYGQDAIPEARGAITCATCHEPHQWSARNQGEGPGRNTEGDTSSSFLRLASSANFVCADCHGEDALFRYKYFHGKSSRKDYPLYLKPAAR